MLICAGTAWKTNDDVYTIDISGKQITLLTNHLHISSNINPEGETLNANSLYFIRNGKPWYPVMGEFHFARYPKEQWEESILKMKAAGVDIISSYIFWIYHEEEEGRWDWTGNKDLKYFVQLCTKHNIYFFARIGPWAHGEVRNGGFPDWLLVKSKPRRNDSAYLKYVSDFFLQINQQLKGNYFKEGGSVIGAQIENEFRFNNPSGLEHMLTLKSMAQHAGIDVPFYTATGWPGSNIKQTELIPVWGAYPEAPWDKSTGPLKPSDNYLFKKLRSDPAIGSDLLGKQVDTTNYQGYIYPYATAEMGGGNQITYHRRPIIQEQDVTALAYVKIGSGANLMGYYMFHGGSNPIGRLSTLQESKATKYPNDYPIINYDFYAPIGQWGQLRPSYKSFKQLHLFLNDFGDKLATYTASFPEKTPKSPDDVNTLRWSVRSDNKSGFIFINNFERQVVTKDFTNVQFKISTKENVLTIPEEPATIRSNAQMILPFNLQLSDVELKYSTCQLVCKLETGKMPLYVFAANEGLTPEYLFYKDGIQQLTSAQPETISRDNPLKAKVSPGLNALLTIHCQNGKSFNILTLTHQQALDCWKGTVLGKERLLISSNELIFTEEGLRMQSTGSPNFDLAIYPAIQHINISEKHEISTKPEGLFTVYSISTRIKNSTISFSETTLPAAGSKEVPPSSWQPEYTAQFKPVPDSRMWNVTVPARILSGLSDAFLKIDYSGDTFAAYLNDTLVADDFYAGLPLSLGLKRFGDQHSHNFRLLVTPLADSSRIYFEKGIREALPGKNIGNIRDVTLIPQYQVVIRQK